MQSLVEKYRPATLDAFAGLERPRAILSRLAARPYSSAWFLLGPSGLGKTTMALAVARAIGAAVHKVPSRACNLETVQDLIRNCHYAPMFGEPWHLPLIDEANSMSKPAQDAFLSVLDTTGSLPNTIFIFTANDTTGLEPRFLSRCRVVKFDHDGLLDPASKLLAGIWAAEAPAMPAPDFAAILTAAHYNVRTAIMNLELEMIAPSKIEETPAPRPAVIHIDHKLAKRREAAKRAWITIRARRAAQG